ncbi:4Fe-4S dicluster domain-containing protein [Nanchangia anserum]|uniref:4Fe-4S dicluster domain-containing protein n=1 Tax=Nanchangia anserum TaxID=2692125 RepID=A0A8I0G8R8_9ACTO|nr:4Fe-4S dicluster domain-containing protein [Nanchangia anserum]MBD3689234.1 4Fe-4S dicluster domain-containing protein [Nanchangia anserum]QOX81456.1 4Fe-4S dicluster domain-containing protein [Nanchangia anserum]
MKPTERSIHERLSVNRYQTDETTNHIEVNQDYARATGLGKVLVAICPAHVYTENPDGSISVEYAACLECGTCTHVGGPELLTWHPPAGGAGVSYRHG